MSYYDSNHDYTLVINQQGHHVPLYHQWYSIMVNPEGRISSYVFTVTKEFFKMFEELYEYEVLHVPGFSLYLVSAT